MVCEIIPGSQLEQQKASHTVGCFTNTSDSCCIFIFVDGVRAMCSSLGSILILPSVAIYKMQEEEKKLQWNQDEARVEQMKIYRKRLESCLSVEVCQGLSHERLRFEWRWQKETGEKGTQIDGAAHLSPKDDDVTARLWPLKPLLTWMDALSLMGCEDSFSWLRVIAVRQIRDDTAKLFLITETACNFFGKHCSELRVGGTSGLKVYMKTLKVKSFVFKLLSVTKM